MQSRKELYDLLRYTPGKEWHFPENERKKWFMLSNIVPFFVIDSALFISSTIHIDDLLIQLGENEVYSKYIFISRL
jgi:hypothetical protein